MTEPKKRRKRDSSREQQTNGPIHSGIDVDALFDEPNPTAEPMVSVEQAVAEVLRRQRARASLTEYASAVDIPGAPVKDDDENEIFKPIETRVALHHRVILEACQRCLEKPMGRLMIFAPPGSAKSTYASVVTPVWAMQKWKGYQIILASYGSDLARKHSRKARALARQDRAVAIWEDKATLNADQRAVDNWSLSNGSSYMAAGLLAGITGNRADAAIVDDPVAGRKEADSDADRKSVEEAFRDDLKSRLKPNASIILIQTRWNEGDLSGTILPEDYDGRSGEILCRDGQVWEVLNIPAEAERPDDPLGRAPGEFLWPEWFPTAHWLMHKNDPRGQRTWASLYQQRPTAAEGIEFKREWFKWYDPDLPPGTPGAFGQAGGRPKQLTKYGGTDWATKEDKGDFTEHGIMGIDPDSRIYFLDWWYGQKTTDVSIDQWILLLKRHGTTLRWWHEGGPIGNALTPPMIKAMRQNKTFTLLEPKTSIKNKAVKLAAFQAMAAAGLVYFPLKRPWASRIIDQLCGFPSARYDDAADVCGLFGRGIDDMSVPYVPSEPARPTLVPFTGTWLEYEEKPYDTGPRYI